MSLERSQKLLKTELEPEESDSIVNTPKQEMKNWSDLPNEILEQIGTRLPLIGLLGFRSTCKDWLSASSTATAACEYTSYQDPWFLLYENSNCRLYQPVSDKVYSINIPELDGSTVLASKEGWLLLAQERLTYFFCPFSRAKISLPEFPHSDLSKHVGVFSTIPTSPDCTVCVINHSDKGTMELNTLKRGANEWTKHSDDLKMSTVTGAIFHEGFFYFLDTNDQALTFSVEKKKCNRYTIVEQTEKTEGIPKMPFSSALALGENNLRQKLGFDSGGRFSLSTCGTVLPGNKVHAPVCIHNEDFEGGDEQQQPRQNKGVWIHPRFFQVPPNQSWGL